VAALTLENEQRVIDYIHSATLEQFPAQVVQQARRCFIDLLACSLAGMPSRTGRIAREFACSFGGAQESLLFGDARRVPLPLAIFANTTTCEALDADDGFNTLKGHPGAFLFPAVLAFAEREKLTGKEVLEALVVGYEVGIRAGLTVHALYPSYHGSGSWGGVGTAAVAVRCMRLNAEQSCHALAAAEYHGTMAPIMRCVRYPGMVKDGVAWGAFGGITAAIMARQGFTSTPGLFAVEPAVPLVNSLGKKFLMQDLYFKPYCCCRWAHAPVRAAVKVVCEHQLAPEEVDQIQVGTFAEACALSRKIPATSEEAQYSVSYPVAAALVHGDVGPEQVLEGSWPDPRVVHLMSKIEFRHREDFQAEFPAQRLAEVKVSARGQTYSSGVVAAHGDASDPLSDSELYTKFSRYAAPHLSKEKTYKLYEALRRLDQLQDIELVLQALQAGALP